jgi:F-type H+-transporting ATPase subunit b
MEELVKTFHIETGLLLAQVVNFFIVFLVLYRFAYKPVLKMLNERTEKIEKGLTDSQEAMKKLENAGQKEKEILALAKKEAQSILEKADERAKKNQDVIVVEARNQSEKMLIDAKVQIEMEKEKMLSEIREKVSSLVVEATGKILHEKIDAEKDRELIERAIK